MRSNWKRRMTAVVLCAVLGMTSLPLSTFAQEEGADGRQTQTVVSQDNLDTGSTSAVESTIPEQDGAQQGGTESADDTGEQQGSDAGPGQVQDQQPNQIQTGESIPAGESAGLPQESVGTETGDESGIAGRTEPMDWTNRTGDLKLTLQNLSYLKGDERQKAGAEDNRIDLSGAELPGDKKVTLEFAYSFLRDANESGESVQGQDTFSFLLDPGFLKVEDTTDPVDVQNEEGLKTASYTVSQGKIEVTFADLAGIADNSARFELEAVIQKEAFAEEISEHEILLQEPEGEEPVRAVVVLPQKQMQQSIEEGASGENAGASDLDEARKEESKNKSIKAIRSLMGRVAEQPDPNKRPEGDEAWDCTNANEQLKLEPGKLFYKNKETGKYELVTKGADGKYNFGDNYKNIDGIKLSLDFTVLKDGDSREIKPGDYFHFKIPAEYFTLKEHAAEDIIFSGIQIGEFIVSKDGDNYDVKVIFSNALGKDKGYTNIKGGLTLTAELRESGFVGDGTGVDVPLDYAGTTVTLHFPNADSRIDGIEKKGTYLTDTNQMQWEITVGTNTPGVSLSGVQVTDILPFAQDPSFHFKGKTQEIGTFDEGSRKFQYTFTEEDERKAPQTIVITSTVPDRMIPGQNQETIRNTATMSDAPDAVIEKVGDPQNTTSENTFDGPSVTKEGEPINSDIIRWTLTVNGQNPAYKIWNPVIYDGLPHNLKLAEGEYGSVTIQEHGTGNVLRTLTPADKGEIPDSPNPSSTVTEGSSAVYTLTDETDQADDKYKLTKLAVSLGKDIANPINKAYDIVFYTTVIDKGESIQADNALKYHNKATMKGWVGGNGVGPGTAWKEFNMDVDATFNSAYIEKTTPSYDEKTGEIIWEIRPSTRLDSYKEAVITDTITWPDDTLPDDTIKHDGKHTLVDGSVEVWYGNTKLTEDTDYTLSVGADHKTFTVTLDGTKGYVLKDIKVVLRTQAENFNQENQENRQYHNQTELTVTDNANTEYHAGDDAQRDFGNNILTKASQGFETDADGNTYLHYLITVNGNDMDLSGPEAVLSDDLSSMVTAGSDPEADWKLDTSKTTVQKYNASGTLEPDSDADKSRSTNDKLEVKWTNGFDGTRVVNIYLKLDNKQAVLNKDVTLSVKNTAALTTPKLNGGGEISYTTSGNETLDKLENNLITKENGGLKVPPKESQEASYIDWTVRINPNHVALLKTDGSEIHQLTVEDTLPAGVMLDYASIELTDDNTQELSGYNKDSDVSILANSDGTSTMSVKLPKDGTPGAYNIGYILKYRTKIIASSDTGFVTNHVVLKTDGDKKDDQESEAEVEDGVWGSLTAIRGFQFYKYDAALGGTKKPLANVEFGLYDKDGKSNPSGYKLVDKVVSRADGNVMFLNLSPDKNYAYKELTAAPGYVADSTYHDINITGSGVQTGAPVHNQRIKHSFSITKKGLKGGSNCDYDPAGTENLAGVEFLLFANYTGENPDDPSAYTQVMNPSTVPGTTTGSFVSDARGKVDFGELPWGNYYVCEAKAAAGYHLNGDSNTAVLANSYWFQVKYDERNPYNKDAMTVSPYSGPAGSGAWKTEPADFDSGVITNYESHISFKKWKETDSDNALLDNAEFKLYKKDNPSEIKNWNTNALMATNNPGGQGVQTIYGLLPGDYTVKETARSSDLETDHTMLSIDFQIDAYGRATLINNYKDSAYAEITTEVTGGKVTNAMEIVNKFAEINVEKVDQFGSGVLGATFGIYRDKDGNTLASEVSPNSFTTGNAAGTDVKTAFKKLKCKTAYWLVETGVPVGYFKADPVCFMITDYNELKFLDPENPQVDAPLTDEQVKEKYKDIQVVAGNVPSVKLCDVQKLAPVGLKKQNDNNAAMSGVQFELYKKGANPDGSDDKLISVSNADGSSAPMTTDENGMLRTGKQADVVLNADNGNKPLNLGLKPGTYYFKELDTSAKYPGYHYDANKCKSPEITVTIADTAAEKENVITFTKNPGNNALVWNHESGDNAKPADSVTNTSLNAYLLFDKVDAEDNSKKLAGAKFELYQDSDGKKIAEITTAKEDGDGTVTGASGKTYTVPVAAGQGFYGDGDKLQKGEYTLKEVTPPQGYQLAGATEWKFTVSDSDYNEVKAGPSPTAGWKPVEIKTAEGTSVGHVLANEKNKVSFRKTDKTDSSDKGLEGAEFELTCTSKSDGSGFVNVSPGKFEPPFSYDDTKKCITWTSASGADSDAALAGHLIAGETYEVTEVTAPDGYRLPSGTGSKVKFKVNANGTLEKVADSWDYNTTGNALYIQDEKTKFAVEKIDSNGHPVYGSEFVISTDDKGQDVVKNVAGEELKWATSETNTNRKIWDGVKVGTYYLVETKTAPGLQTAKPIQFELDTANAVTIKNDQGKAEIKGSDGYYTVTMTDPVTMGHVTLKKTDNTDAKKPLEKVKFELFKAADATGKDHEVDSANDTKLLSGIQTDASGEWTTAGNTVTNPDSGKAFSAGLGEGFYYFRETETLPGYALDEEPKWFEIGNDNYFETPEDTVKVEVANEPLNAAVRLRKVDGEDGKGIPGTTFTLYKIPQGSTGEVNWEKKGEYTTGAKDQEVPWTDASSTGHTYKLTADGELYIAPLEKGTYALRETKAADGYVLNASEAFTATFTIDNTQEFKDKVLDLTEDVSQVDKDQYQLAVKHAAYKDYNVANARKMGTLTLQKADGADDAKLNDVGFTLYKAKPAETPGEKIKEFFTGKTYEKTADASWSEVSGDDGTLTLSGLAWGDYYIEETSPLAGYVPDSTTHEFTIDGHNTAVVLEADLGVIKNKQTEIRFQKLGKYNESCSNPGLTGAPDPDALTPMPGVEFTASSESDPSKTYAAESVLADITDENGQVTGQTAEVVFKKLPIGTYLIRETKTLPGYQLSDTVYKAQIDANGQFHGLTDEDGSGIAGNTVINDVHRASITFTKVDEKDPTKVLPGSTYGLYKKSSDIKDLEDNPLTRAVAVPAANERVLFSLMAAEPLAEQTPAGDDMVKIAEAVTDANGVLTFDGVLMNTEYVIRELAAPDGHYVSANPITLKFEVDEESGKAVITEFDDGSGTATVDPITGEITWLEPVTEVAFAKKDEDRNLLAGARLHVEDAQGRIVEEWTSSAAEMHTIRGLLTIGEEYTLVETNAPAGYQIADPVKFTVDDAPVGPNQNKVQIVEMVDKKAPPTPPATPGDTPGTQPGAADSLLRLSGTVRTGDASSIAVYVILLIIAAGAVAVLIVKKKKK